MRANFGKAAAMGDEAPLYFYSHLFLTHPETRQLFPVSMAHQRDRLFAALGEVVARVDDLDSLVPILQQLGRDHRKFGTVAAHYPAVGASLLATLEHFDDGWDGSLAADWTAAYQLVAQVMVEAAESVDAPPWWDAVVVSHERRTFDVAVLRLQPKEPLDFRPGESISLETARRPRLWRYYSPANAPRPDGLLEIHVRAHDGGPVSSALVRQVEVVDHVAQHGPARRVDLFVGARLEDHLYDRAELDRLAAEHPWLTVTVAVSEDPWSSLEHGNIAEVAMRHGPWTSRDVYAVGPGPMVDDTVACLVQHGVPRQRVRTEVFAPSRPSPTVDGEVTS